MSKIVTFYNKGSNKDHLIEWEKKIKETYRDFELVPLDSTLAKKSEIALLWKPPFKKILKLKNLSSIISLGQGVDHIINHPNFPRNINVYRIVDPHMAKLMSHWVILSILNYIRDYEGYRIQQKHKIYKTRDHLSFSNIKIGIYGIGEIGKVVANDLLSLGFEVIGWSRTKKKIASFKTFYGKDGFLTLNKTVDIHICLLPLTDETKNIFDKSFFELTKYGICFINAGRGEHLVEEDFLKFCDLKKINLAFLDVFKTEPLPKKHPFWQHKKIIITPHVSAETNIETAAKQVANAIRLIHLGKVAKNQISLIKGY